MVEVPCFVLFMLGRGLTTFIDQLVTSKFMSGAALFENAYRLIYLILKISAHQIKNLKDQRVAHAVKDLTPRFTGRHNLPSPEDGQVLRHVRLFDFEPLHQIADRELTLSQFVQYGDAGRVRQRLEDFSFELAQGIRHECHYTRNV